MDRFEEKYEEEERGDEERGEEVKTVTEEDAAGSGYDISGDGKDMETGREEAGMQEKEPLQAGNASGQSRSRHVFMTVCLLLPALLCLILAWQLYEAKNDYLFLEEKYQEALAWQERMEETREEEESREEKGTQEDTEETREDADESGREEEPAPEPEAGEETVPADIQEEPSESGREEEDDFQGDPSDWRYLLVNEKNPLAQNYDPELVETRDRQRVDLRIAGELEEMLDAAKEAGHDLLICSSYRDYARQDELIDKSIERYVRKGYSYRDAFFMAKKRLAITGTSEHHTGLAVDIVGVKHQTLDAAQGVTPEAVWLKEHCAEYGFILRYPAQKEDITGISGESWHFRYVGREAAEYIVQHNLSLEEFVEMLQAKDQSS